MRLIDANVLVDRLMHHIPFVTYDIFAVVNKCETVDPVKHGRWIDVMELVRPYGTRIIIKCSECGKQQVKESFRALKYCNECGAKMDERVKE